jgi:NTP pyrophosphatase (non-canonical NTP hydrolase)
MDNKGFRWETSHGRFVLNAKSIQWIMNHVQTSMYNDNRCYVYNKAFAKWCDSPELFEEQTIKDENIFNNIREWAQARGLYNEGNVHTQYVKLQEEAGELAKALLENDKPEIIDAIGDMVVVLTNLAALHGWKIEQCIDSAYNVINKRTGKMINGTFVKDEK